MLFKELSKFIKNLVDFINGSTDLDKQLSEKEYKALLRELKKAGIEVK